MKRALLEEDHELEITETDPRKLTLLGLGYVTSETPNYKFAFLCFQKAARQNYALAQYHLARCYYYGNGIAKNSEQAIKLLQQSADKKFGLALCALGDIHLKNYLEKYGIGDNIEGSGEDDEEEEQQASREEAIGLGYYHTAAEHGYIAAYFHLYRYYNSIRESQDANKYLKLAADNGHCLSQFSLGENYQYGETIDKDIKLAIKYYQLAAAQGSKHGSQHALINLGKCYLDEGAKDFQLARKYLQAAYRVSYPNITFFSAAQFDDGIPVEVSDDTPFWYHSALEQEYISKEQPELNQTSLNPNKLKF